jgi:hypothetical protein
MSSKESDSIDLKPYLELVKRTMNLLRIWLKKKLVYILIVFAVLTLYFWSKELLSADYYERKAAVHSELLSHNQLLSLLSAVSTNVRITKGEESQKLGDNSFLQEITRMDYSISISEVDSLLFEQNHLSTEKKENIHEVSLNPIELSVITKNDKDSLGSLLMDYLNSHPYTKFIVEKERFYFENRIEDINAQIEDIDSIKYWFVKNQRVTDEQNPQGLTLFMDQSTTLIDLYKLRISLSDELILIKKDAKDLNGNTIIAIDGFSQPKLTNSSFLLDSKNYVVLFLISLLIVSLVSFLLGNSKN